jgi:MFS family permease
LKARVGARTLIAVMSLASVFVTLAVQAVSPALPEIKRVLDLSNSQVGWLVTTYVLPGVVLTVPMGVLGDRLGRRHLFVVALITYGAAGVVQGLVASYPLMLAMRTVQGASFAAAMPLTITLIGEAFTGAERIRALAGRNAVLTFSEVVLPLGGALLGALSWRAPLFIQAVAIPLGIYSYFVIEEHQAPEREQKRYARDLLHVLREQQGIFAVLLIAFSRYFFKLVLLAYLPVLLVTEGDASLTEVGIVVSFGSLVAVITTTRVPALIQRIPPSAGAIGSIVALCVSLAGFSATLDWRWALVAATVYGLGDGVVAVLQDTYAIHVSRSHVRAGMVSVSQTARNLGKFVGPLVMTAIVAISSVEVGFLTIAAIGLLMAPAMLQLRSMDDELASPEPDLAGESAGRLGDEEEVPYE